jgi:quinol monooxygenase YgiN
MEFMNIVRVKVKPDHIDEYMKLNEGFPIHEGQTMSRLVKTGDNTFCYVGIWESEDSIAAQREAMIEGLDKMRHTLEEISPDLGVTDPVSGPVVIAK